jgi:hypothetical protein
MADSISLLGFCEVLGQIIHTIFCLSMKWIIDKEMDMSGFESQLSS